MCNCQEVYNLGYSLVQEGNNLFVPIAKRLNNYDWFMSSEIKATPSFSIRPEFDILFNRNLITNMQLGLALFVVKRNRTGVLLWGNLFRTNIRRIVYQTNF